MKAVIFIVFASLLDLSLSLLAEWSYNHETEWPGVCTTGKRQSPINVMSRDAVVDKHEVHLRGPLNFRGYEEVRVSAINNGHTLQWNVVQGSEPRVSGGPLRGNYSLMQFHLHWLSEHAIDGMKYSMEIHMVHVRSGMRLPRVLEEAEGIVVIGVLCQVRSGPESAVAFEEIMPVVPQLVEKHTNETGYTIIDMRRLFSPQPQSYYSYHGSLTTPNCEEIVTWILMDNPLIISDTQFKLFSKVDVGGVNNYRSLQPVNRVVYRSIASCSSIIAPSFIGFLGSMLTCLASNLSVTLNKGVCYISNLKRRLFGSALNECSKKRN